MAKIERFEDIEAWKLARVLAKRLFLLSRKGEFAKDYKLRDQTVDAACSIGRNIAEGFERGGRKEFIQFLGHAKGSSGEVRSSLYNAFDFGYISEKDFEELRQEAEQISEKLARFINYLNKSTIEGIKFKSTPQRPTSDNLKH